MTIFYYKALLLSLSPESILLLNLLLFVEKLLKGSALRVSLVIVLKPSLVEEGRFKGGIFTAPVPVVFNKVYGL